MRYPGVSYFVRNSELFLSRLKFQRVIRVFAAESLRIILVACLPALLLTGCGGVAQPTSKLQPDPSPSPSPTPTPTPGPAPAPGPTQSPSVASVSPASGATGTEVIINGANFASGAAVSFGSVAAPTAFVSSTQLTSTVPALTTGAYDVTVTDPGSSPAVGPSAFTVTATVTNHYLYAINSGPVITVYDIDNNFKQVKQISAGSSSEEIRGAVASAVGNFLYISYGCTSPDACTPYLMKYDLGTDAVVWNNIFQPGIDSHAISPDGKTIYMPTGEGDHGHSLWYEVDTENGNVTGTIDSGVASPHNTIVSNDGSHIYMGATGHDTNGDGQNYLVRANQADGSISAQIGPVLNSGTRPFTIDATETYAFVNANGLNGFQVGSISNGKILYTVSVTGFSNSNCTPDALCSHGISLSPDGEQIYVVDYFSNYVHVFDVGQLASSEPKQIADIPLNHPYMGADGWVTHSRDGRFVFVGESGDVIDTATQRVVSYLPVLNSSKVYTEIDFQNGAVSFTPLSRSGVGYPK